MNAPHLVKAISDRRAFQLGAEEFQPLLPRRAVIATIGTATVEPPPLKPPPLEPRTRRGLYVYCHWNRIMVDLPPSTRLTIATRTYLPLEPLTSIVTRILFCDYL